MSHDKSQASRQIALLGELLPLGVAVSDAHAIERAEALGMTRADAVAILKRAREDGFLHYDGKHVVKIKIFPGERAGYERKLNPSSVAQMSSRQAKAMEKGALENAREWHEIAEAKAKGEKAADKAVKGKGAAKKAKGAKKASRRKNPAHSATFRPDDLVYLAVWGPKKSKGKAWLAKMLSDVNASLPNGLGHVVVDTEKPESESRGRRPRSEGVLLVIEEQDQYDISQWLEKHGGEMNDHGAPEVPMEIGPAWKTDPSHREVDLEWTEHPKGHILWDGPKHSGFRLAGKRKSNPSADLPMLPGFES